MCLRITYMDTEVLFTAVQCSHGEIRLVGGKVETEGLVEICIDDHFQTICDDFWDSLDATVVCRQLNFSDQSMCEHLKQISIVLVSCSRVVMYITTD